jgi:Sec-independent protein translocase protein TatA
MYRPVADSIQLLILIIFATLILLPTQLRELMRQIARTAEEWHRMRAAMRDPRRKHSSPSRFTRSG